MSLKSLFSMFTGKPNQLVSAIDPVLPLRKQAVSALTRLDAIKNNRFNVKYSRAVSVQSISANIEELTLLLESYTREVKNDAVPDANLFALPILSTNIDALFIDKDGNYINHNALVRFHQAAMALCEQTDGWEKVPYGPRERNYRLLKKSYTSIISVSNAVLELSQFK